MHTTLARGVPALLKRLVSDECGQDLLEYALLTSIITAASVLAFFAFAGRMQTAYTNWVTDTQNVWEPLPPG